MDEGKPLGNEDLGSVAGGSGDTPTYDVLWTCGNCGRTWWLPPSDLPMMRMCPSCGSDNVSYDDPFADGGYPGV